MRSGGNRNPVIPDRMIKARFSSFVCPVAPYVSYFRFTSCQGSVSLLLHDAQRFGYVLCGIAKHFTFVLLQIFFARIIFQSIIKPALRIAFVMHRIYSSFLNRFSIKFIWSVISLGLVFSCFLFECPKNSESIPAKIKIVKNPQIDIL